MRALRNFEEYVRDGVVRRVTINSERAESLVVESARKMLSLKERLEKLGIKNENANDYVEYCYDILMHLVRAKLCLDGYSANGQGAHEAEVSYLRMLAFAEREVQFADQMRYFRNGILYYGTSLDAEYAEKVTEFTKRAFSKLKGMIKQG
ncbi:hypothetical protein HYU12_03575 [Candidatus Woesearchaeota archaeon]|nr:hypothetical protein [Candidatus Woesearchaeota archaeon]